MASFATGSSRPFLFAIMIIMIIITIIKVMIMIVIIIIMIIIVIILMITIITIIIITIIMIIIVITMITIIIIIMMIMIMIMIIIMIYSVGPTAWPPKRKTEFSKRSVGRNGKTEDGKHEIASVLPKRQNGKTRNRKTRVICVSRETESIISETVRWLKR